MRSSCAAGISAFFAGFLACCAGFLACFTGFFAGFLDDCFFDTRGVEDLVFVFLAGFLAVFLLTCFFAGFLDDRFFDTRGVEDLVFVFFAGFLAVFLVACFFDGRFAFLAVDVAPSVSRGSSVCDFVFAILSFHKC
ncbi:MAG: hypothetical protein OXR71_04330 [Gemmatimonadota bacterium]|nr:hypothetical protein [Gemmatimonadota bacterium]